MPSIHIQKICPLRWLQRGFTPPPKFRPFLLLPRISGRGGARDHNGSSAYSGWKRLQQSKFSTGFTLIEAVVILAIITALSATVLFSFTGFNENAAMNRSARELALALRKAQNMSLAVTRISVGGVPQIPAAIAVQLNRDQSSYFFFGDLAPRNNKYDGASEFIGTEVFERNVRVTSFKDKNGGELTTVSSLNIIFAAPEAVMTMTNDADGSSVGDVVMITLTPPSGKLTKILTVRTSGQISIK